MQTLSPIHRFMKTPDEIMNGTSERLEHLESDTDEQNYVKGESPNSAACTREVRVCVCECEKE